MKAKVLLNYYENVKQIEEEEQSRFLRNLLEQMGVPIDSFWNSDMILNTAQRINLRKILSDYNINVIDDLDGHLQIYVENELVGEWFKSTYSLKRDLRETDLKKQRYLEMQISNWTIFEENE